MEKSGKEGFDGGVGRRVKGKSEEEKEIYGIIEIRKKAKVKTIRMVGKKNKEEECRGVRREMQRRKEII
jgi:hypothetical protein